jgi:hypothetical protein
MEDVGIFYGHLSILRPFGIFCGNLVYFEVIWYIFLRFGILYQEQSGNPAWDSLFSTFELHTTYTTACHDTFLIVTGTYALAVASYNIHTQQHCHYTCFLLLQIRIGRTQTHDMYVCMYVCMYIVLCSRSWFEPMNTNQWTRTDI